MPHLSKLQVFNPALIYSFEPESSAKALLYGETANESIYKLGQYNDMLEAYLYAERDILPWIQQHGLLALTPSILEQWIITLHQYIGKTVLSQYVTETSGKYSTAPVFRWHYGSSMIQHLGIYMEKMCDPQLTRDQFLKELVTSYEGLGFKDAEDFLEILERLLKDERAPIHASLRKIKPQDDRLQISHNTFNKLMTACHEKLLTKAERKIVKKIVICVDYPERIPAKMRSFCKTIVPLWQNVDKNNLQEVGEFCSKLFYQFTSIHPFSNANGRTATAINNIILRSLGLFDMLMRKPGDRSANSGDYAEAIACIETDRKPLTKHLQNCINEAQNQPFADPVLRELCELRMDLCDAQRAILAIQPKYDLDRITNAIIC